MQNIKIKQTGRKTLFLIVLAMFMSIFLFMGCSDNSKDNGKDPSDDTGLKTEDKKEQNNKTDLGELGFVTEFVEVEDTRDSYDGSVIYLMRNENNDVYVLMGFCEKENGKHLVGETFEVKKVTNGFKAYKLLYSKGITYGDDRYFYIWDDKGNIHKCTIHIGKYSSGTIIDKNVLTTEEMDIPGEIISFDTTHSSGNYVLTKEGDVYAWYNSVNGSPGSDYQTYLDFKEVVKSGDDLKENTIGFTDGMRHDTPTKLPLSNIKQMFSMKDEYDRVYLSNSGEVYRRFYESGKVEYVKLDKLEDIKEFYPTESSSYAVGINSKNEAEVYYLGKFYSDNDTRIKKTALSGVKFEKAIRICDRYFFKEKKDALRDVWQQGDDYIFVTYDSNHGREYYKVKDDKVSLYVPDYDDTVNFDKNIDYVSMNNDYTDIWLDKSGTVYWYSNANKDDKYIIAQNVRGYTILDIHNYYIPYDYDNGQFNTGIKTVIYQKDGKVKAFCGDKVKKGTGSIIELDFSYFGNGTYGRLVPGENGKYNVCNRMEKDGSYSVAAELELPR